MRGMAVLFEDEELYIAVRVEAAAGIVRSKIW
jgi:hypothetical protein